MTKSNTHELGGTSAQAGGSTAATGSFHALELDPKLHAALDELNFTIPTPIQEKAIPIGLTGQDIIGIAQTGTGKTLAFGLPLINRLIQNKRGCGRALIILPTRELALQVDDALTKVGHRFGVRSAVLIGGAPMRPQQSALNANPDLIIATPGRLIDHLQNRNVDLRTIDVLVLDEADRMLDMGFAPQIKQILREVPEERQTLLFSATMPDDIVRIANDYMVEPARIEIERAGTLAENISQELFVVSQDDKNFLLEKVLDQYSGSVLVFARTRSRARRITRHLRRDHHSVAEIHSDRTLVQRRAALDGFKAGEYRVLIATDIAARGIDVTGIEVVVNYDLPDCPDDYVHRIGRTARAGREGHAISFAAPDQHADVRAIEKLTRCELTLSENSPEAFPVISRPATGRGGPRGGSRGGSYRGNGGVPRNNGGGSRPGGYREGGAPRDGGAPRSSSAPRTGSGSTNSAPRPAAPRPTAALPATRPLRRGTRIHSSRNSAAV